MTLINADQLDTSPVEWTVDQVVPRTGIGIMWGPSTAGKSLVGFDLALAVANGVPFMGHQVRHPGAVAYCLGEGLTGAGIRLKARQARQAADDTAAIAAMARDHGDAAARAMIAALPAYTAANVKVLTEGFSCHFDRSEKPTASMARALAQLAMVDGLELVIIDALADFKGQLSLANDSSAGRIVQGMKFLASELNCCVLAIAHPVADGHKMAGSERLFQASDFVIEITPDEVGAPGALKSAAISSRKSKEDEGFAPVGYAIEPCRWEQPAEDEDGNEIPGQVVTVKSATVRLLERPAAPSPSPAPAPALPVLQPVPRPAKRNGIRSAPRAVPDQMAAARTRRDLTAGILAEPCPECSRPGQVGCDTRYPGSAIVPLSMSPPLGAHEDRILASAIAGHVDLDAVIAALAA